MKPGYSRGKFAVGYILIIGWFMSLLSAAHAQIDAMLEIGALQSYLFPQKCAETEFSCMNSPINLSAKPQFSNPIKSDWSKLGFRVEANPSSGERYHTISLFHRHGEGRDCVMRLSVTTRVPKQDPKLRQFSFKTTIAAPVTSDIEEAGEDTRTAVAIACFLSASPRIKAIVGALP